MKKYIALLGILLLTICALPLFAAPLKVAQAVPFAPANRPGASFKASSDTYSVLLDKKNGMFGKWTLDFKLSDNVEACKFQVRHNGGEAAAAKELIVCAASWVDEDNKNLDAAYLEPVSGELFSYVMRRPKGAEKIRLSLAVRHFYKEVTFSDIVCEPVEMPPRPVRIVTAKLSASGSGDVQMDAVWKSLEKAGEKPDLVIVPEVGQLPCVKGAQTIPGAYTDWAAKWAKKLNTNVIAGMKEVRDGRYFRSAAVIDRTGKLVGVYRKTHLTAAEVENGFCRGEELPVFDLDFGKTGVLISSDFNYPETARALRLKGAEVVAGLSGDTTAKVHHVILRVRAMENGIVLASACSGGKDTPARIFSADGNFIAETYAAETYAAGTVDLTRLGIYIQYLSISPGNGETRSFYMRERQPELYRELSDKR